MARYLITSALPYINGIKHLGNLAGSMLPADVHARFRRMQGHEVLFLCATDEHGTPAELAAREAGMTPRAYCDEQHLLQRTVYEAFHLSFDWFGRSSNPPNHQLTQHLCQTLEDNGRVDERTSIQIYSPADGRFLPDRYILGTCPHCGDHDARGDQCDRCGRLLDPVDLIEPRSAISGSTALERRETVHLYLRQADAAAQVKAWLDQRVHWSFQARAIAYKGLRDGLKDRAITRDLEWGIQVLRDGKPRTGFENKRFYVWFDAPIEYIGAAVEWAEATGGDWRRWWRCDAGAADVEYVQFMGKDNVAFHAASFPITLLGSGEPWKLVDRLKAFHWVNWYGGKFSTSQRRGIFMDQALELLPADYWRWYLMANAPENDDVSFTLEHFQTTVNADLANVFGNFVNRVTGLAVRQLSGFVPPIGSLQEEVELLGDVRRLLAEVTAHHEALEFRKAAAATRALWSLGNSYFQRMAPWEQKDGAESRNATALAVSLNLAAMFALVAMPFLPATAARLLSALQIQPDKWRWPDGEGLCLDGYLGSGARFAAPPILFSRVDRQSLAAWAIRFGADPQEANDS
jgi:methionyl-tRNA synthetase